MFYLVLLTSTRQACSQITTLTLLRREFFCCLEERWAGWQAGELSVARRCHGLLGYYCLLTPLCPIGTYPSPTYRGLSGKP